MQWLSVKRKGRQLLNTCCATPHRRIISCFLLALFCYFSFFLLPLLVRQTLQGSSSLLLSFSLLYVGLERLWQRRAQRSRPPTEERWLGYFISVVGIAFLSFAAGVFAKVVGAIVLCVGIFCSLWGLSCFYQIGLEIILIGLSLHPNLLRVARQLWSTFAPPQALELFMAWSGSFVLNAIGTTPVLRKTFIYLNGFGVEVLPGCDGFDMAFPIAAISLVLGLFLRQSWQKIAVVAWIGVVLALLFNIVRVSLMTYATAYWGQAAFEFWHGEIGGQIFSGALFTVYYYVAMAILQQKEGAKKT